MKDLKDPILVTGCAGFIGFHLCKKLLTLNHLILGIDNLNNYYDQNLKKDRLEELNKLSCKWEFIKCDLCDNQKLKQIFLKYKPKIVVHLAAQAGVRYSIINPNAYINSNIVGFSIFTVVKYCINCLNMVFNIQPISDIITIPVNW